MRQQDEEKEEKQVGRRERKADEGEMDVIEGVEYRQIGWRS